MTLASATLQIPDVLGQTPDEDFAAVLRALALTGLKASGAVPRPESTLLERLAALPHQPAKPDKDQDPRTPVPIEPERPPMSPAHLALAREIAAPILFPPPDLPDYDRVFALPLMAQGQPVPARLAVATRKAPNGQTTTFLRVDCELSRLGSVSVRMSGGHGGPMAITVFAGPRGAPTIAAGLPALTADLRARGYDAAIRVVQEDGS